MTRVTAEEIARLVRRMVDGAVREATAIRLQDQEFGIEVRKTQDALEAELATTLLLAVRAEES